MTRLALLSTARWSGNLNGRLRVLEGPLYASKTERPGDESNEVPGRYLLAFCHTFRLVSTGEPNTGAPPGGFKPWPKTAKPRFIYVRLAYDVPQL